MKQAQDATGQYWTICDDEGRFIGRRFEPYANVTTYRMGVEPNTLVPFDDEPPPKGHELVSIETALHRGYDVNEFVLPYNWNMFDANKRVQYITWLMDYVMK